MVPGCEFPVELSTTSLDHHGVQGTLAFGVPQTPLRICMLKALGPYPGKVCLYANQYIFQGFISTPQGHPWIPNEGPLVNLV